MSHRLIHLVLFVFVSLFMSAKADVSSFYVTGVRAITGDVFEATVLEDPSKKKKLIKLFGVTAPKENEPYFIQSKTHLNNIITSEMYKIYSFKTLWATNPSEYDTEIAIAQSLEGGRRDNPTVNELVLILGFVKHNESETSSYGTEYRNAFGYAAHEAKKGKKGMWAPNAEQEVVEDTSELKGFGAFTKKPGAKKAKPVKNVQNSEQTVEDRMAEGITIQSYANPSAQDL